MVSFYWPAPHDLLQNSTNISDSIFGKSSILLPSFIIAGHCGQNKKDVVIFELVLPNQPDQPSLLVLYKFGLGVIHTIKIAHRRTLLERLWQQAWYLQLVRPNPT